MSDLQRVGQQLKAVLTQEILNGARLRWHEGAGDRVIVTLESDDDSVVIGWADKR